MVEVEGIGDGGFMKDKGVQLVSGGRALSKEGFGGGKVKIEVYILRLGTEKRQ